MYRASSVPFIHNSFECDTQPIFLIPFTSIFRLIVNDLLMIKLHIEWSNFDGLIIRIMISESVSMLSSKILFNLKSFKAIYDIIEEELLYSLPA